MSSTNKGNYEFCKDCKFRTSKGKYPCSKSHRDVRRSGNVKYERDFKMCGLHEEVAK